MKNRTGRLASPCLLLLALLATGAAQAAVTTRHLPSDAAADAAVAAGGGAYRFATEAKAGRFGPSDWELAIRRLPRPVDSSQVTAQFDRWSDDVPVLFTLTYLPPLRQVVMTLTRGLSSAVVTNRSTHDVVGDFTDLFVRAVSTHGNTCVSVSNLFLDGLPVGDRAEAWHGGGQGCRPGNGGGNDGEHDLLQISGGRLDDGFLLTGTITFRWQGNRIPRDDEMDVQIWGAKIGGAPPADSTPPTAAFTAPAAGALVATATPEIAAAYSDGGSGIDTASVSLLVDGTDRTAEATITASGLTFTPSAPLAEGAHAVSLTVRDGAGNPATASRTFTTDSVAPTIVAIASPAPNAAGWNNGDVTVSFDCADAGSGVASCSGPATVTAEGFAQEVAGAATDQAGNTATASVIVNLDRTAPALAVLSPPAGTPLGVAEATLTGTVDSTVAPVETVLCDGVLGTVTATSWTCTVGLDLGPQLVAVEAVDLAGNSSASSLALTVADPSAFTAAVSSPADGLVTAADSVEVAGLADGPIAGVEVNGVAASFEGSAFTAEVPLIEGTNRLVATVTGTGGATATAVVTVRRDTHLPLVVIESPPAGSRLIEPAVTVSGTVNDVIPGVTVNADDVTVTVNGQPAAVMNRAFTFAGLPLALGANAIDVTAVDRAGNSRTSSVVVTREPDLAGIRLVVVSGNDQDAPVGGQLPLPLVVRIETREGQLLPGRPIVFTVSNGDGVLGDPADALREVTVLADENGEAEVTFRLGSRTGEGFHRVRATTPGSLTSTEFCATGDIGVAQKLAIARMPPRRGLTGQPTNDPLAVIVTDGFGNPVANAAVTFQVELGGGQVNGLGSTTVSTDPDGIAVASFTPGPSSGRDNNRVTATFAGYGGLPAVFTISGVTPGAPEDTTISGVVQNSVGAPIVGARVVIEGTSHETTTGPDGRFLLTGVPPGGHLVAIHAGTANDPGAGVFYPSIDLAVDAFPGVDNPLNQVLVLPFLDPTSARLVGGDEDVELGMQGVPGFKIKIRAHSTILHDGTRAPLVMSSSQVKLDKMPMPAPQGSTPLVVGTLQPGGIHFDPPAEVTYPNTSGLAPGDVADLFAFHHDIGQFVNIGPGTVSPDGRVITSNPGFGFLQSGWHGVFRDPGDDGEAANDCHGEVEWQGFDEDGNPGPMVTSDTILLFEDPAGARANVFGRFGPNGGSYDSQSWTGGDSLVTRSGENAGGTTAAVVLTAGGGFGDATVTSPIYRFEPANAAAVICQVAVQVAVTKVEIVNPAPAGAGGVLDSSATSPNFNGNEFTYSTASPGVLTIPVRLRVTPDTADNRSKLQDKLRVRLTAIAGSTLAWNNPFPGDATAGKAVYNGSTGLWEATATFTRLPTANSSFGRKMATVEVVQRGVVQRRYRASYEVFFPRDATNNPGGAAENWFYYWNQTGAGDADMKFSNDANTRAGVGQAPAIREWSTFAGPRNEIRISDSFRTMLGFVARNDKSGIDGFANIVIHENRHVRQVTDNNTLPFYKGVTGAVRAAAAAGWSFNTSPLDTKYNHFNPGADGKPGRAGVDDDSDGTIDEADEFRFLVGGDIALDTDFDDLGINPGGVDFDGGSTIEGQAAAAETGAQDRYRTVDWADPGKQHGPDGGSMIGEVNRHDN